MVTKISDKNWGHSDKLLARQESVIDALHKIMGKTKLEPHKELWSLGGLSADNKGLKEGCELDHFLKAGIITPEQYHCVEHNSKIAKLNQAIKIGNWYSGEFLEYFFRYCQDPGLINFDHHKSAKTVASKDNYSELHRLLQELEYMQVKDCLLIVNVAIRCSFLKQTVREALLDMTDCFAIKMPYLDPKKEFEMYTYGGTDSGERGTQMMTIYFKY